MTNQIAQLLYDGAVAVQQGQHEKAQELLLKLLEIDEANELAWLWLSGAVQDPADQQVALENVLALNPNNQRAIDGLAWLQQQASGGGAASSGATHTSDWVPPPPRNEDDVDQFNCWQCQASLYSVAEFCWQCHAAVHCCNNCVFRNESRCKELQGLTNTMAQVSRNDCPWWRTVNV
jgi:tetratricopeptide (TPR) repeat protein